VDLVVYFSLLYQNARCKQHKKRESKFAEFYVPLNYFKILQKPPFYTDFVNNRHFSMDCSVICYGSTHASRAFIPAWREW